MSTTKMIRKGRGLESYCRTDAERELLRVLSETGGDRDAMAAHFGVSKQRVADRLYKLRKRANRRGWSPDHDVRHPTPDGYHLKGTSTLYSRDPESGKMRMAAQWVKTDQDREDQVEAMRIACAELAEPIRGCIPASVWLDQQQSCEPDEDLMATYLIGDHHLGMYSWAAETGADYDTDIGEKILNTAFDRLIAASPNAVKALIVSIGDFFHADNHASRTPQSGNSLDTDSRHSRVIQAGIRSLRRSIGIALTKHREVEVAIVAGNHDPESSIWLAHALAAAYDSDPRVMVQLAPRAHRYVRWGKCLIGLTHGDKGKAADLPAVMAVDCRIWWGEAAFCHIYTGHLHHKWVQEYRGCTVECLKVLTQLDAWHAGQGYRSERGMQLDIWHKTQGRILTFHGPVAYIEAGETVGTE